MAAVAQGVAMMVCASAKYVWRETGESVGLGSPWRKQALKQASFLRSDAHALAVDRIEAADGVAEGEETARERGETVEMPPAAGFEAVTGDAAERLGVLDGVVDRGGPYVLRVEEESVPVIGRLFVVAATESEEPAVAFHGQQESAATVAGRIGNGDDRFPIGWGIGRDVEGSGGVADVDADRGLGWRRLPDGLKHGEGEEAVAGGIDDEIRGKDFGFAVTVLAADTGDRGAVGSDDELDSTTTIAKRNIAMLGDLFSHRPFDERAGHAVHEETEIALGHVAGRTLEAEVGGHAEGDGAGFRKAALEIGKETAER